MSTPVATLALARQTHLAPLFVFGAVLIAALVAFWCIVAFRTARGALDRTLFVAPCLITGAIPGDFEAGRLPDAPGDSALS